MSLKGFKFQNVTVSGDLKRQSSHTNLFLYIAYNTNQVYIRNMVMR